MILNLRRTDFLSAGIFGLITDTDGKLTLATAEHSYPDVPEQTSPSTSYHPKIPPGQYSCVRRLSPRFGYDVFWVTQVPNCEWIEIHRGNFPQKDSDGCILLGTAKVNEMITDSKTAFDTFMSFLGGINTFELVVS